MTASVGSLLDDVHALAWVLCSGGEDRFEGGKAAERAPGLLAGWPGLAAAALRALGAVRVEPHWLDETGPVREVLARVASDRRAWLAAERATPTWDMTGIRDRLGLIADLLAGQPTATSVVDQEAVAALRTNLIAPLHAVAVATVAVLDDRPVVQPAVGLLRGLVARTERFAAVPPRERSGRYEDVAAVGAGEATLDGALARWVRATTAVLSLRHVVTGPALQVAAGDSLIVTAMVATVCGAAVELGHLSPDAGARAVSSVRAAHERWRGLTTWPATVRLDGLWDAEHADASRELRNIITDTLRHDRAWLSPQELADRCDVPALLGSMRRGMHAVGKVGLAHFQAVENHVRGQGQLWISARALALADSWTPATIDAALRRRWVPMPRGEPAGEDLLGSAREALTTTLIAVAATDATATAVPPAGTRGGLRWEGGRIATSPPAAEPPSFETVRPRVSPGIQAERRAPIPVGRPTGLGPRR